MKYLISILFSILFLISKGQGKCRITYISNEGFLVELHHKKIMMDGLFAAIDGDWCDSPNDSIVELMKQALPPFDHIDLISVSHQHRDHFEESVVVSHLLNNDQTKLVCPNQVFDILSNNPHFELIKDRIFGITPAGLNDTLIAIDDIDIRCLRLNHSTYMIKDSLGELTNKHENIENLGFVFNIDGNKLFHCGDADPSNEDEFKAHNLKNDPLDIAFLERLFYSRGSEAISIIDQYIQPKNIIVMHIGPGNQTVFANHFKAIPNIYVFQQKMDQIILELE
jgi:L-ascorbate metabolism protein UlaG (beta-lactamase superfamily)